ncbi:MAG: hypothetical protein MUE36_12505 [Acidimicrobiales bacterium]|nr:hypothetical protein [Acidimicrobiales bacterium]
MTGSGGSPPGRIVGLVGVYHANGSLTGELAYWVGARLGRAHCALCDITHGTFRAKPEFARCRADLAVPFETVHLDERSAELAVVTEGHTPCVVARVDEGDGGVRHRVLLGPDALEACQGEPAALMGAIEVAAAASSLSWA